MKAKNLSGQAPGGKRTPLAAALPLDTPYVVQIFPIYACNFKCNYCIYSVSKQDRYFISDTISMNWGLYCRCIDEMIRFPNKIKVLRFVGIGEPLLHKQIVEMIEYAVKKQVANVVEILTNGALLTPQMSDALIDAGLDRMVISLQGTSAESYLKTCETEIDYTQFVENIRYFYQHKKQTQVYIKVIDCALEDEQGEELFYRMFGDICDTIAVENAVPIHAGVNFESVLAEKNTQLTQFGLPVTEVKVCPQPFFTMQINPDGKVVPCYSFEYPEIVGDCNDEAADQIWTGEKFQNFRRRMLSGAATVCEACKDCSIIKYRIFPEDDLAQDVERLKKIYGA